MNRRLRTLVVLAVAVLCAALATAGVLITIRRIPATVVEAPQASVVVAARAVAMGIRLTEDDVKVVQWPSRSPVAGTFSDVKLVLKRGLIASLVENEPLTEAKLAHPDAGGGLPPSIRQGMRAVSVKVNEVIGVAGFVVPGARVDVLVTIRQTGDSTSRMVVSNAHVLTAGTRFDQEQAKDGKPIPTTVVTLMVNPDDAERIALAASEGSILLTLRNPLDTGETRTPGVRTAGLLGGPVRAEAPPAPTKAAPSRVARRVEPTAVQTPPAVPAVYVVDSIRAGKRAQEVVR